MSNGENNQPDDPQATHSVDLGKAKRRSTAPHSAGPPPNYDDRENATSEKRRAAGPPPDPSAASQSATKSKVRPKPSDEPTDPE